MECSHGGVPHSSGSEQTTAAHNNTDEFHEENTKEYLHHDPIYIKFRNRGMESIMSAAGVEQGCG